MKRILKKMLLKNTLLMIGMLSLLSVSCPSSPGSIPPLEDIDIGYVPTIPDAVNDHPQEAMGSQTAQAYFTAKNLSAGWNLGNSLDAHRNGMAGETEWGNPAINQALLNGVKAAGFNLLRLPVTWMGHIGSAPDYHVAEARLARVAEVVDMAHNAGLVVIINLHHDGATANTTTEAGWLSINKALASASGKTAITVKFMRLWKQIATYFKNYGDYLIFEGFNELHDGQWFWETRNVPKAQYDLINEWNQIFVNTVRATGGNNAERFLVIQGYCTGAEALLNGNFELPTDSASGKQILSFHYYRPDNFALNGTAATWGTVNEKAAIDTLFARFKAPFINYGIPVIIGETGPVKNGANTDAARQARAAYASYMFGKAKENGLVPVYWDNGNFGTSGEVFGLINRTTGQPNNAESTAVIGAMINAVR